MSKPDVSRRKFIALLGGAAAATVVPVAPLKVPGLLFADLDRARIIKRSRWLADNMGLAQKIMNENL